MKKFYQEVLSEAMAGKIMKAVISGNRNRRNLGKDIKANPANVAGNLQSTMMELNKKKEELIQVNQMYNQANAEKSQAARALSVAQTKVNQAELKRASLSKQIGSLQQKITFLKRRQPR